MLECGFDNYSLRNISILEMIHALIVSQISKGWCAFTNSVDRYAVTSLNFDGFNAVMKIHILLFSQKVDSVLS